MTQRPERRGPRVDDRLVPLVRGAELRDAAQPFLQGVRQVGDAERRPVPEGPAGITEGRPVEGPRRTTHTEDEGRLRFDIRLQGDGETTFFAV